MRYITAFLIKFVMITAVLWIVLGLLFDVPLGDILTTSIILTTVTFVGDVFILPRIGNVMATIGDFALAFVGIWILGEMLFDGIAEEAAALISALIITIGELFYHRYLRNQVFDNVDDSRNTRNYGGRNTFQIEASDELNPRRKK